MVFKIVAQRSLIITVSDLEIKFCHQHKFENIKIGNFFVETFKRFCRQQCGNRVLSTMLLWLRKIKKTRYDFVQTAFDHLCVDKFVLPEDLKMNDEREPFVRRATVEN